MRAALLAIVAMLSWSSGLPADARGIGDTPVPAPVTVSTVSQGVRLSLRLSGRTYPRNALVQVQLSLTNVSTHAVSVGTTPGTTQCGWLGPGAEVDRADGTTVYPPAVEWIFGGGCRHQAPAPLQPGATLRRSTFVVLRGAHLEGTATVGGESISTPQVSLHLTAELPPSYAIQPGVRTMLIITPGVPEQRGAFYYVEGIFCGDHGTGMADWARHSVGVHGLARGLAPCDPPTRWVFTGGWLNHPVVQLDYSAGASTE